MVLVVGVGVGHRGYTLTAYQHHLSLPGGVGEGEEIIQMEGMQISQQMEIADYMGLITPVHRHLYTHLVGQVKREAQMEAMV